jgi:hypothetical protein
MFDFADWINGVETPAETVVVFQKPGLIAEIARVQDEPEPIEAVLGEAGKAGKLARLHAELQASKSIWYISPLHRDTEKAILKQFPDVSMPRFAVSPPVLADRANDRQSEAFIGAFEAWKFKQEQWLAENAEAVNAATEEMQQVALMRGAARLAAAVTYIEVQGEKHSAQLTPQDIIELERQLGSPQVELLVEALNRVSTEAPQEPDPTN